MGFHGFVSWMIVHSHSEVMSRKARILTTYLFGAMQQTTQLLSSRIVRLWQEIMLENWNAWAVVENGQRQYCEVQTSTAFWEWHVCVLSPMIPVMAQRKADKLHWIATTANNYASVKVKTASSMHATEMTAFNKTDYLCLHWDICQHFKKEKMANATSQSLDFGEITTHSSKDKVLSSLLPTSLRFKIIHISAIVALFVSILASIYTVAYLRRSTNEPFYKWKIGKSHLWSLAKSLFPFMSDLSRLAQQIHHAIHRLLSHT